MLENGNKMDFRVTTVVCEDKPAKQNWYLVADSKEQASCGQQTFW